MYGYNDYGLSNLVGEDEYEDSCLEDSYRMMRSMIKYDDRNSSNILTSLQDNN
jgi:hypothetical protein